MDGFHALGTQGRSHPRKRQDPAEAKVAKKKVAPLPVSEKAAAAVRRQRSARSIRRAEPKQPSFRVGDESKAKHHSHTHTHTSQPLTLAPTSLPPTSTRG